MKEKLFLILFALIFAGCSEKKIEITPEYIINENWSKKNEEAWANSITIQRMKVKKDSVINPLTEINNAELLGKLEEDTPFMHYANVKIKQGESYKGKKIYFNQYNGFYWGNKSRYNSDDTTQTIGALQHGSWYRFSDLGVIGNPYYIYIYIDSTNTAHRFDVNLSNY